MCIRRIAYWVINFRIRIFSKRHIFAERNTKASYIPVELFEIKNLCHITY